MIFAIYGKIDEILENSIVINVNNVYYEVYTSNLAVFSVGDFYKVYLRVFIREDGFLNVGFSNSVELDLFNNLLLINGIGIKIAINAMKSTNYQAFIAGICNKDIDFLTSLHGINETMAALICAKLSKKFSKYDYLSGYEEKQSMNNEVFKILLNLGYKNSEINKIKDKIPNYVTLNEGLRVALKELANVRRN